MCIARSDDFMFESPHFNFEKHKTTKTMVAQVHTPVPPQVDSMNGESNTSESQRQKTRIDLPPNEASKAAFPPGSKVLVIVDTGFHVGVVKNVLVSISFPGESFDTFYEVEIQGMSRSSKATKVFLPSDLRLTPDCPVEVSSDYFGSVFRFAGNGGKVKGTVLGSFEMPPKDSTSKRKFFYSVRVKFNGMDEAIEAHGVPPEHVRILPSALCDESYNEATLVGGSVIGDFNIMEGKRRNVSTPRKIRPEDIPLDNYNFSKASRSGYFVEEFTESFNALIGGSISKPPRYDVDNRVVPSDTEESTSSFEPEVSKSQTRKSSRAITVKANAKGRSRSLSRTKATRQRSVSRTRTYARANSGSEVVSRSETRESNSARLDLLSCESEDSRYMDIAANDVLYRDQEKPESDEVRLSKEEPRHEEDPLEYGAEDEQNDHEKSNELTNETQKQQSFGKEDDLLESRQKDSALKNESRIDETDAELEGFFNELDPSPSPINEDVEGKAMSSNGNGTMHKLPSREGGVFSVRANFETEEIKFTSSSESSKALNGSKPKKKFGKTFFPHNQERSPLPKSIAELQIGNISPTSKKKLVQTEVEAPEIPALQKELKMELASPPDEGCYLLYSPSSGGRFITIYSREKVDGAIGFWRPGEGKKLQGFKFKQNQGRSDLMKDINGSNYKSKYFSGWCQFVKAAKAFNGFVCKWNEKGGLEVDLYVFIAETCEVKKIGDGDLFDVSSIDAVACLPRGNSTFNGVKTGEYGTFLNRGNGAGGAMSIE